MGGGGGGNVGGITGFGVFDVIAVVHVCALYSRTANFSVRGWLVGRDMFDHDSYFGFPGITTIPEGVAVPEVSEEKYRFLCKVLT